MNTDGITPLPADVRLIDALHLGQPHVIGVYLLLGDQPALVDPGPSSTLASVEAGLAAHGLKLEDLHSIFLTHIHLDHAGVTGTLVERYPHLRVYVHQRGAPHLIAPEKLIRSATRLYGDAMDIMWGTMLPVPELALTVLSGGELCASAGAHCASMICPYASHHVCYFDEGSGAVFVGDTGGACRPDAPTPRPATPPPDIDIEAWQRSLDTLRSLDPTALLLTHYGPAYQPAAYIEDYRAELLRWAEFVRAGLASGADEATQIAQLSALATARLDPAIAPADITLYEQASSSALSWQGLARYWRKRAEAKE